jgi:hypothetical protein
MEDDLESSVTSSLLLDDLPKSRNDLLSGSSNLTSPDRSLHPHAPGVGSLNGRRLIDPDNAFGGERTLHAAISAHLSGDWSHPKRLAFTTQYVGGCLFLIYALCIPSFPRQHLHLPDHPPHSGEGDSGFGRNWLAFLLLFQAVHQFALGYASSASLQLQVHEIEYYERNFAGVVAWLMGGLSHIARMCLLWDVSYAHGHEIGGGTIFLLLSSFFVLVTYFFYAYRSSLSAPVAAVSSALLSLFLSAALFGASSMQHVAPGSAIGAGVGLWMYALLVYPMMCMKTLQNWSWVLEGVNIMCWTWLVLCYQGFDNCAE